MPFDGTEFAENETILTLLAGRAVVAERWGLFWHLWRRDTVCAITALPGMSYHAERVLICCLGGTRLGDVFDWNDHWTRRKRDVLALYDRAIEMEREALHLRETEG